MNTSAAWSRAVARAVGIVLVVLGLVSAGCSKNGSGDSPGTETPNGEAASAAPGASGVQPSGPPLSEPPPKPTMPKVLLTEEQKATCRVGVGDTLPGGELTGLDGSPRAWSELLGKRLTVVFFWNLPQSARARLLTETALGDLALDVAQPYAEKGVHVVGINVGDAPQTIGPIVQATGAEFPQLLDPQGAMFSQAATGGLPRIYLLDAEGKILWFDLEYSRSTHDALLTAIRVTLGEV